MGFARRLDVKARKRTVGFTLIELLVVMAIIGLLVALLVPTVSRAMEAVRKAMTSRIIKEISVGLENYRSDFGEYPPSRPYASGDSKSGAMPSGIPSGAANLAYYLRGPAGRGWGIGAGGWMPSDPPTATQQASFPSRTYGPYYQTSEDYLSAPVMVSSMPVAYLLDAFKPVGRILYWRYDPTPATGTFGKLYYDVTDNGTSTNAKSNYADQARFDEIIITTPPGTSSDGSILYVRYDYLLVSPGVDGRYGYVTTDSTGNIVPASRSGGMCDDVTNWTWK